MRKLVIISVSLLIISMVSGGQLFRWLGEKADMIREETLVKLINYLDKTTKPTREGRGLD